jgi:hypothetical protein
MAQKILLKIAMQLEQNRIYDERVGQSDAW